MQGTKKGKGNREVIQIGEREEKCDWLKIEQNANQQVRSRPPYPSPCQIRGCLYKPTPGADREQSSGSVVWVSWWLQEQIRLPGPFSMSKHDDGGFCAASDRSLTASTGLFWS